MLPTPKPAPTATDEFNQKDYCTAKDARGQGMTIGRSPQPMRKQGTFCGTKACLENHGHCIPGSITIDVATGPLTTVLVLATGTSRTTSPHRPTRTSAA